jgi:hypothetical protein
MAYVQHGEGGPCHCVFTRAPRTAEEIERAIDAMCDSEVCGIRYGGTNPDILRRVASRRFADGSGGRGEGTTDLPLPRVPNT